MINCRQIILTCHYVRDDYSFFFRSILLIAVIAYSENSVVLEKNFIFHLYVNFSGKFEKMCRLSMVIRKEKYSSL